MNSAFHDKGGIGRKLKNKRKNQSHQAMIKTVLVTKVTYLRNYYRLERRDPDRTTKKTKANSGAELNFCRGFVLRKGDFCISPTAGTGHFIFRVAF